MWIKSLVMVVGIAAASTSFAYTAAERGQEFTGTGTWNKPDGTTGNYRVITTVTNTRSGEFRAQTINSKYNFGPEKKMEVTITAVFNQKNQFHDMIITKKGEEGQEPTTEKVGGGYCIDRTCHYSIMVDDMIIEETITTVRRDMQKIGSKSTIIDGTVIRDTSWTESLRDRILPQ